MGNEIKEGEICLLRCYLLFACASDKDFEDVVSLRQNMQYMKFHENWFIHSDDVGLVTFYLFTIKR